MNFDEAVEKALLQHEKGENVSWSDLEKESGISKDRIRSKVRRILGTHDGKLNKKYDIVDDYYQWTLFDGTPIKMHRNELDELFYAYSDKGLNLSSYEIRMRFDISAKVWNSIKHRFELYKSSNVFSPETIKQAKKANKLEEIIETQIKKANENTQLLVEKKWEKELRREYKKVISTEYNKNYIADRVIEGVIDCLDDIKSEAQRKETIKFSGFDSKEVTIVLTDLHIGVQYKHPILKTEYNDEIVLKRLLDIAAEINTRKAAKVNIVFLGDYIESFSGLNHMDSWKALSTDGWGAAVVYKTYTILKRFLMSLNGELNVYAIGGNHDRASNSKDIESVSQISKLIFTFLKETLDKNIKINYSDNISVFESGGVNYILTHGDKSISKKSAEKLILDYGNNKLFNVLLQGHLHEPSILGISNKYLSIVCPSILSMNPFAEQAGYVNNGGWVEIEPNQNKSVNFKFNIL